MAINPDRNYGQLLTAAVARSSRETQDIVYNATPLTRILRDSGRIQVKRAGGPELRIPVEFDKLQAQWFTGYDKIEITPKELLNSAMFNWSRVVSMFSLTGTELLYTSGEEEIIDLMSFYVKAAQKTVKEEFELGIVGDGTGSGGRQMVGFGGAIPILPNTGTYGGVDRMNVAAWRTSTFNATTGFPAMGNVWDSTTARPIIEQIALARSRGSQYPDLWIFDSLSYQAVSASFVAHQRLATERSARLGYSGLAYHPGRPDRACCGWRCGQRYAREHRVWHRHFVAVDLRVPRPIVCAVPPRRRNAPDQPRCGCAGHCLVWADGS